MRAALSRALELAREGRAASVECLAELVRIPSLTGEEGPAQLHLAALLDDIGAEVELIEPDLEAMFRRFPDVAQYPTHWQHDLVLSYEDLPTYEALRASGLAALQDYRGRPNVVARFAGRGGGRSLLLNAHVDTVTVEPRADWTRDPFGAEIEDGRMYGRGTSDMKGGLMAAIMAVRWLGEAGVPLMGDVVLTSVVNEEHAGNGTLDLVTRGERADAAIVLEPTHNTISVTHPGGLYFEITVPGRARSPGARWHGANLEGVSAIEKLPVVVEALLELEARYNRGAGEAGRAPFALVLGRVQGGHYETVTAPSAVLRGGAYFAPHVGRVQEVMAAFREAVAAASRSDPFLAEHPARLAFLHHDDATWQADDIAPARHMGEVLRAAGGDGRVRPGPFACDLRHLVKQGGMPAIIFGPGAIAQAHKADEHIDLAEYQDCILHLIRFIASWCNAEPLPSQDGHARRASTGRSEAHNKEAQP